MPRISDSGRRRTQRIQNRFFNCISDTVEELVHAGWRKYIHAL
jgi:hypothetical protein